MTNVAVLGCGNIARSMARTLRMMRDAGEDVVLYAAAARETERAEAFARAEGFEKAYGSYEAMLADPAVDLVYVATPHSHHVEHMKLCIEAGKAVLCEKAFTGNAQQAEEVLLLAEQKRVLVTEAIWTRYMPSRRLIDEVIASGEIGRVRFLTANLGYPIENSPRIAEPALAGGALLDLGVYALNFASMALGDDVVSIESSAQITEKGVDLTDQIVLEYASGAVAHLSATAACRTDRHGVIYGEKGWLTVDNINNPVQIDIWREDAHVRTVPVPPQFTGYEYEVRACMKALADGAIECPEMPHAETLAIMRRMDELRAAWGVRYPFDPA
ncbi:MAG: Gfo/Idh/MocA family oxidoreductase [Clostridia bacterium]|nr:Gfo/Idh/MocA family oxidoreductase [Clostridia bacterium]